MAHEGYHEPVEKLDEKVIDRHRAIVSIMEEFEAVDWYDQRVSATADSELAEVLAHNRDEEKEHAAMTLEWLRRRDAVLDENLRTYLFTDEPVTEVEESVEGTGRGAGEETPGGKSSGDGSLGIGDLKADVVTKENR
ncbi:MAG: ferritin-like domain-containing protein [Acidimicrobiia bacterium]